MTDPASRNGSGVLSRILIAILLLAGLLSGCQGEKRKNLMDQTLRLYERSIKWGAFLDAQTLLLEIENPLKPGEMKEIKVTSYEVLQQQIGGDFERLDQVVEIKFFHEQQGTVHTLIDNQTWVYDEESETWLLQSGMPDFNSAIQ